MTTTEDAATKAIIDPYVAKLNAYNNTVLGQTTVPIDALQAFTQETNGANLQADASVYELNKNGITPDIHISGAMTNKAVATAGPYPVTLKVSDMFSLMPYENSLVMLN
jgi:2',3'-cyclic-nucleotide 2'-phosphodiesterase (5'-nucleotidase family)